MTKKSTKTVPQYQRPPFLLSAEQIADELKTNFETGLRPDDAEQRLQKYGENKLDDQGGVPWWKVLLKQIFNAMILVLILAMALSYGVTDWVEGGVITAVIVLNVSIGFFQEYRAEQTMEALRSMTSPTAAVLRDGAVQHKPSAQVVPGDIVQLKTGDVAPADLRVFESMNLEMDEALLTGESLPVVKDPNAKFEDESIGVGDRINMVYSSSTVTKGRCRGIVIATGMSTEIGAIAESLKGKPKKQNRSMSRKKGALQPIRGGLWRVYDGVGKVLGLTVGTPLQVKLAKLAYVLLICAVILAIIVFGVNKFNVTHEVAIYAISLGIAIIPESLIAVLTITMAVGMRRMVKRMVIVRKLDALEALGGVTNICSDKTGTLTQGKMITRKVWIPGVGLYSVEKPSEAMDPTSGSVVLTPPPTSNNIQAIDHEPRAVRFTEDHKDSPPSTPRTEDEPETGPQPTTSDTLHSSMETFLHATSLCNLATVFYDKNKQKWLARGDPTEIALQVFAQRFEGFGRPRLTEAGWEQLGEFPFDSDVKRMTVVYQQPSNEKSVIFTKGAVERVLELCVDMQVGDESVPMTEERKEEVLREMTTLAEHGLRVLALARRYVSQVPDDWSEYPRDAAESGLTLLGLAGLYDPPRPESKEAVKQCSTAGIRVHMLTGDHPDTARAIAREVGIIPANNNNLQPGVVASMVKTAAEFDAMSDEQIDRLPVLPLVIARCAPQTKVRMIQALHRRGAYCAMTGDGVNDSPSLKQADVGIAMGLGGSDVAKAASAIVLTDDNFASIVNAIEEGRRMFDGIQAFTLHLLCTNIGEVILLVIGLAFQDDDGFSVFPLSPLEILWINMLTSSFPAFGLGLEKAAPDVMRRPPHDTKKGVFTWQIITDMFVYGVLMGSLSLCSFVIVVWGQGDGNLGSGCNSGYTDACDNVFRARGTVFAVLTWLILITAWELKSIRRSMFRLDPYQTESAFPFFKDMWANKFLFWSVVLCALSVFPAVMIPGLNTQVFRHKAITWEWGLAVGSMVIYVLAIEAWKLIKRRFGLFNGGESDRVRREGVSLAQGFFPFTRSFTKTFSRYSTWESRSTYMEKNTQGESRV